MRKTPTMIGTVICSLALAGGYAYAQTNGATQPQTQGTQNGATQNGTMQNGTMQNGTMQNGANGSMSRPPASGNSGMQGDDANGTHGNQNSTLRKSKSRKSHHSSGSNQYPTSG